MSAYATNANVCAWGGVALGRDGLHALTAWHTALRHRRGAGGQHLRGAAVRLTLVAGGVVGGGLESLKGLLGGVAEGFALS